MHFIIRNNQNTLGRDRHKVGEIFIRENKLLYQPSFNSFKIYRGKFYISNCEYLIIGLNGN